MSGTTAGSRSPNAQHGGYGRSGRFREFRWPLAHAAASAGYDLVLGYGVNQTGVPGAHASGIVLVDGTYIAPCVPDGLADIMNDLRAKRITQKEAAQRIKARAEYAMRTKEVANPAKGIKERLTCPAAGPNPTAICALEPKSQEPRPVRQPTAQSLTYGERSTTRRSSPTASHPRSASKRP